MKRDSFTLRKSFMKPISRLTDAQRGRLFKAIYQYHCGETPEVTDDIAVHFSYFESEFEEEEAKRRRRAEKAAERRRKKLEEAKVVEKESATESSKPEKLKTASVPAFENGQPDFKTELDNLCQVVSNSHPMIYNSGLSKLSLDDYKMLRQHISALTIRNCVYELADHYPHETGDIPYIQALKRHIEARKHRS